MDEKPGAPPALAPHVGVLALAGCPARVRTPVARTMGWCPSPSTADFDLYLHWFHGLAPAAGSVGGQQCRDLSALLSPFDSEA